MLFKLFTIGALIYILFRISSKPNLPKDSKEKMNVSETPANERNTEAFDDIDFEEVD